MTEQAPGQHLAETFLSMINTHDPGPLDRSVAEDYRDHNACATNGREANRQFWTTFFAAIPDLSGSLDGAADDAVAGDDRVLHRVRRRADRARRLVRKRRLDHRRHQRQRVLPLSHLDGDRTRAESLLDLGVRYAPVVGALSSSPRTEKR
jgi:hypothetical protein